MIDGKTIDVKQETPIARPVDVSYLPSKNGWPHFISVDGGKLGVALQEKGYLDRTNVPLVVEKSKKGAWYLAQYNPSLKKVFLDETGFVGLCKKARELEYKYIEGEEPGKLSLLTKRILGYLDPVSLPHHTLRKQGELPTLFGNQERRRKYLQAAREGFVVGNEDETQLSKEDSIKRAKETVDRLLEKSLPKIVGWLLAYEYMHRDQRVRPLSVKILDHAGPAIAGVAGTLASTATADDLFTTVAGTMFATYFATQLDRREKEDDAYKAGDKYFNAFAKAVSIDRNIVVQEIFQKDRPQAA